MTKPPTKTELKAMKQLIDYLQDERTHWEEAEKPVYHIYQQVRILERYIERQN